MGIEPSQNPLGKLRSVSGVAQNAAHESIDPELAVIITAWSQLPEAIKVGILALVRAAT